MLGPVQTIIHLDRSIRLQLALRNVIGKLRTRTQAELIPMPIERMLKALTQRQFHPLHTGRQSAFQTVAVPELPAIRPPVAVMRLIPGSKLQERQQLIASPHLQPPPVCLSQIILVRHSSPPETVNAGFNLYSKPTFAQVAKSFSCARREKDETPSKEISKTSAFVHEDILLTISRFLLKCQR